MRSVRYLARAAEKPLTELLKWARAVVLVGPRQAGKSTLAQRIVKATPSGVMRRLDDPGVLDRAKDDPRGFVSQDPGLVCIDEIQLAPELFRAIKLETDVDPRPGRFLLTGSARLAALPALADALVGRADLFDLLPLSRREITGRPGEIVSVMFDEPASLTTAPRTGFDLATAITGGFPEAVSRASGPAVAAWHRSYASTVVRRAVVELGGVSSPESLERTLRLLAVRTAGVLNIDGLARDLALPPTTLRRHLDLLTGVYVLDLLPAWVTNAASRMRKAPKIHLVDSGLAAALSGVSANRLGTDRAAVGPLLESFVVGELRRQAVLCDPPVTIHHFRSGQQHEIDVVLERADGTIVCVEVKAGATVRSSDFAAMRYLQQRIGKRFVAGYVVSLGADTGSFGNGCHAINISALWAARI